MRKNNHKKLWKRSLTTAERVLIQAEFTRLNGQILEDTLVNLKSKMDPDLSIAQISGFIVALHNYVRKGILMLQDLQAYHNHMITRRMGWATWNSDKYRNLRDRMVLGGIA